MTSSSTHEITTQPDALLPEAIARRVLTVGPEHVQFRGGIGGVMNVYAHYIRPYKYVTTHKPTARKWHLLPFFVSQYTQFIRTLRTDQAIRIVHIQASSYGSFYRKFLLFVTAKYGFGKQTIYHMHGSEFQVFYRKSNAIVRSLIQFLIEHTDVVICLSAAWKEFFTENFRVRRIEVLGNVIHPPDRQLLSQRPPAAVGPLRVLFLGAIGDRKGVFDLLDVVRAYKSVFIPRLELLIGGNGETDRLTNYITQHQLADVVRFEGWVSGNQKARLLAESDVYILPSYNEGLPVAILEAMSYQLPIISTPVGGTAEIVLDGVNGFLVAPGDKPALFDRLMQFVEHPERARQMGQASGELVKRYQPEAIFPALGAIYQSMLQENC